MWSLLFTFFLVLGKTLIGIRSLFSVVTKITEKTSSLKDSETTDNVTYTAKDGHIQYCKLGVVGHGENQLRAKGE